jgi:hypothetical protein
MHLFLEDESKAEVMVFLKGVVYETHQDIIAFISVVYKQVDVYGTRPVELFKNGKQILGLISFKYHCSEDEVSQIQKFMTNF